ncbi:MAG: DUF2023 family protein [Bacteroidales bacterium]|nr:DUF2023 family protein [Bacteroidales bacterium]
MQRPIVSGEMRVLMNHIYEYTKGVRSMILCTMNKKYERQAVERLESRNISYVIQQVNERRINLFFGKKECMDAINLILKKSLVTLTPEEDFILGTLLGYDICEQCKRYCKRKQKGCPH